MPDQANRIDGYQIVQVSRLLNSFLEFSHTVAIDERCAKYIYLQERKKKPIQVLAIVGIYLHIT